MSQTIGFILLGRGIGGIKKLPLFRLMSNVYVSFLGNVAVGKTTLLHRFKSNVDTDAEPTVAPQCDTISLTNEQGFPVTIDFWDTAGDEKFRSVIKRYVKPADIVLLCFEIKSLAQGNKECISDWLTFLDDITNTCKIWLVGTKLDLVDAETSDQVANDVREFLSRENICGYYATSSKTETGIQSLLWSIANTEITPKRPIPGLIRVGHTEKDKKCCQ